MVTHGTETRGPAGAEAGRATRILEAVRARRGEWVSYLTCLADLESPTTEPAAQRPIQDLLSRSLRELDFKVRRIVGASSGGMIVAVATRRPRTCFQLLVGHTDTVWPRGTVETMPVKVEASILRGPGVFDMKAGLASVVTALAVLRDLGLEPAVAPVVLFNSDEETGSRDSTRHIRRIGSRASRVFVLEPALGLEGKIKTARKGAGEFSIRILGRSAHAGMEPERGASAIQELAFLVQSLHEMTDPAHGIVVNVGEIQGGSRPNVVAAEARAEVDFRVDSVEEGLRVAERIRSLEPRVPGCRLEIRGGVAKPPLERTPGNRRLWREARRVALAMGLHLEEGRSGGASDGNTTSLRTPTLDGLGAVGDGAHAFHEYVDIDRSLDRCALLAGLLLLAPMHGADPVDDLGGPGRDV